MPHEYKNVNVKLMPAPPDQDHSTLIKLLIYLFSALIGVAAKLATVYANNNLNWKEGTRNVALATLATWLVYNVCVAYQLTFPATCFLIAISAKFSDSVVMLAFKVLTNVVDKWDKL